MIWRSAIRRRLLAARQRYRLYSQKLWFYPILFIAAAVILFVGTTLLDHRVSVLGQSPNLGAISLILFAGSAQSAHSLLGAIAGAWTTILGVVFSITVVVLQLASNKYTSQLIARLERDTITQVTLGSFIGIVTYSLLVLKTVKPQDAPGGVFIPFIGVNVAIFWAVFSLVLSVLFIHHLSRQVQGNVLIGGITRDGIEAVDRLSPSTTRGWVRAVDGQDFGGMPIVMSFQRPPARGEATFSL